MVWLIYGMVDCVVADVADVCNQHWVLAGN